ncbi:30S ribosomal protein S2 [archaeon]|nr:30S ribosomal protein S2 [archaeon]|tara:strand:+ start:13169 stop:13768 length:600 start_codon:yes stop_codon:yes gene_type:complete
MVEDQFLVPLEDYLKVGLHIGTKFRNKYMESFIYKVRPDGLAVLNIQEINKRIDLASGAMSKYKPEEILVVCRRENGWKAAELFSKMTGIRVINGRYPPGILTNSQLENFIEIKLMIVVDPWPDRNAIRDAIKVGVPIIALCDTNNEANYVDLVVPCNNKGKKSLGLVFWILAREYLKRTGMIKADKDFKGKMEEFIVE